MYYLQRLRSSLPSMAWTERSMEREDLLEEAEDKNDNKLIRELEAKHQSLRRALIIVVLLLGCIIVAVALPWHTDDLHASRSKGPAPEIPFSSVTFRQNEKFSASWSPQSDDAWGELMPPGDGFVVIDNPRDYDLPPGKSSRYGEVYDISMWHQLHCLLHMRTYMSTMHSFLNQTNLQQMYDVALAPQVDHILHCFDYLRQAVMCAGDMTLEWPRTESDGRRFAVDGWDIKHDNCRSWDAMSDFVEKRAVGHHHRRESL